MIIEKEGYNLWDKISATIINGKELEIMWSLNAVAWYVIYASQVLIYFSMVNQEMRRK